MKPSKILWSKAVEKQLKKTPQHIVLKFIGWVDLVQNNGLKEARKVKGFHDEPLKGARKGQRSIRLSKQYRAIYIVDDMGSVEIVEVIELNKHKY